MLVIHNPIFGDPQPTMYRKVYCSETGLTMLNPYPEPTLTRTLIRNRTLILTLTLFYPNPNAYRVTKPSYLIRNLKPGTKFVVTARCFLHGIFRAPPSHQGRCVDKIQKIPGYGVK